MKLIQKIFWSIAPILWGYFVYIMGYSPLNRIVYSIIPWLSFDYNLILLIKSILGIFVILLIFKNNFDNAKNNYDLTFFGYKVYVPSWKILLLLPYSVIFVSYLMLPLWKWTILNNIIDTVLVSSIFHECITHGYFIRYKFSFREFIFFNILSSVSFSFMHYFYSIQNFNAINLLFKHFVFSFFMGIIAYRSQRIEVPIILSTLNNIAGNFLLMLALNLYLHTYWVSIILQIIMILMTIGVSHKERESTTL